MALKKDAERIPDLEDSDGKKVPNLGNVKSTDSSKDTPKYTQRQVEELLAGRSAIDAGGASGASGGKNPKCCERI